MSKLEILETVEVGTRMSLQTTPGQICLENGEDIKDVSGYQENLAIKVGDVLLVKDAP